jgi:hypothetical protein
MLWCEQCQGRPRAVECAEGDLLGKALKALNQALPILDDYPCACNDDRDCQRCHAKRKVCDVLSKAEGRSKISEEEALRCYFGGGDHE